MEATFAMGCFWRPQALFDRVRGVTKTTVGYCGGEKQDPSYDDVCTGETGHAEVIHIEFDESRVTFEELLRIFWKNHDSRTLNRQGQDEGTQYRSAIFYHSEEQKEAARASKPEDAVTQIVPFEEFYPAEGYHQKYFVKHPEKKLFC